MRGLFGRTFEYKNRRYYFCDGDGSAYALSATQADGVAFRLGAVLTMQLLGLVGWSAFSLYLIAQPLLSVPSANGSAWFLDSSIVYPVVFLYWAIALLLSGITWNTLPRLAEPESEHGSPGRPNPVLMMTKPLRILALGLFMGAFVAQGFGDVCFLYRGIGNCEIVKITHS